jgi:preprotein translocase subunit SecA
MFLQKAIDKLFGSKNDRALKKLNPRVADVDVHADRIAALSDDQLKALTPSYKERIERGESIDELLPEAFATLREASSRVLNMRHYDVQLLGGIVLNAGQITEMKTGEGKTLVATLAAYLNALAGKGVHVVTVNDYLARRDAEWMGTLYRWMGLSVGVVQNDMGGAERRKAYGSDITYGTNNEFGFDYLRDNMKYSVEEFVQRGHHYAIIDEVDSILIDEARTPLIISGPAEAATEKYYHADSLIQKLRKDVDYKVNEESQTATLTEDGIEKVEKLLGVENIYDPRNIEILHCAQQALRAHSLYRRDKDYVVQQADKGLEVVIVDEFTGRLMPGRRWSDGLHQAVEAKEKVKIQNESQTYATVTFQNYFRMYDKLAGMTGTAETEEQEFNQIYGLDVVVMPPNRVLQRIEHPDVVYRTAAEKWKALSEEIAEIHEQGRPILVGTTSIEASEMLAARLKRQGIGHVVLNAKNHEREAEIVAQAGHVNAVTVATNMAGRGTDILLGGNPEFYAGPLLEAVGLNRYEGDGADYLRQVLRGDLAAARAVAADYEELNDEILQKIIKIRDRCKAEHDQVVAAGGLHVVGTERHEARRIDNQLRGRAGRQGDPGSSRFFLSLEDDLMRIFATEKVSDLMKRLGMDEGVPIEHPWVTKAIANAQKKVEGNNYGIRKNLIQYDDVMNEQRKAIYGLRGDVLDGESVVEYVAEIANNLQESLSTAHVVSGGDPASWDVAGLADQLRTIFGISIDPEALGEGDAGSIHERTAELVRERLAEKRERLGEEYWQQHCRMLSLRVLDGQWKDHLLSLDHLKEGISLRGYAQRDPKMEYKRESYDLFADMRDRMEEEICRLVFLVEPITPEEREEQERQARERARRLQEISQPQQASGPKTPVRLRAEDRIGRNEPCPCGSGKKYKKCCAQANA